MTQPRAYHVLVKTGDASVEVDAAIGELGSTGAAGLHRYFFVARANQTVVMAESAEAPIAVRLRGSTGWLEPTDATPA